MLDSSVLIAHEKRRFDLPGFFSSNPNEVFFIAAITASELLHGVERANTRSLREGRSKFVEDILVRMAILDFDLAIARRHAALWANLEKRGQIIGAHDLQIAATAMESGHSVATLNEKDFRRVPNLALVDVTPFVLRS